MNNFDENDIATLLRLKRHEQPPPGYFEDFLVEFHRRQRAELLRQPAWRVALQRAQDFMMQLSVPSLTSYPAAAAAVLVCAGVLSLKVSQSPEQTNVAAVAVQEHARPTGDSACGPATAVSGSPSPELESPMFRTAPATAPPRRDAAPPRDALHSTPPGHEASLRF